MALNSIMYRAKLCHRCIELEEKVTHNFLHTPVCEALGVEYPVFLAGMGTVAGPELAAAVSNAGALGVMGCTFQSPDGLREWIRRCRSLTDKPFGVDIILPSTVPEEGSREALTERIPPEARDFADRFHEKHSIPKPVSVVERVPWTQDLFQRQMDVILDEKVPVFVSGLGNPARYVSQFQSYGGKVLGLVGNVKNARRVAEGGASAVIAQGHEAGGHTGRIGSLALIPQVVDAVAPTPVIAAGGIGDGRGLLAALVLGAQAVWCGTAFIATHEANTDLLHKQKLIAATEEDTRVTRVYTGKTARVLSNAFIEAYESAGGPILPMPLQSILVSSIQEGIRQANMASYMGGGGGQITGMLRRIKPARQVVLDMVEQACEVHERFFDRFEA
jgi:nitronate monooxygenase